jgi:hypothetical protein
MSFKQRALKALAHFREPLCPFRPRINGNGSRFGKSVKNHFESLATKASPLALTIVAVHTSLFFN